MERRLTRDELHHLQDLSGGLRVVFDSSGEIGYLGMRSSITGAGTRHRIPRPALSAVSSHHMSVRPRQHDRK
jgi:hypothetical protein